MRFKRLCLSFLLCGLMVHIEDGDALASPVEPGPGLKVTTTREGLIVDWRVPSPQITLDADGSVSVVMPGYSLTDQPDAPRLPVASALIALPPDGSAAVQVLQSDDTQFALSGPLALAPSPQGVERDASGAPVGGAFVRAATAVPFPSDSIKLDDLGLVRGVHLARVTFYPVHPSGSGLRVTTHLRASIAFKAPAISSLTAKDADPIIASVQAEVLNPEQVQRAATSPATLNVHSRSVTPTAAIEANTPGMTVVTYEALNAVGFPAAGIDPHNLHLTRSGSNVAYQLQDNGNTLFEPGESLLFYAAPRFSRWTNNDVYMLSLQAAPGMHMTSAAPATQPAGHVWLDQTAETNALYTPQCYCGPIPPGRDGDRWTWDDLRLPDRAAVTYPITLTTLDVTQPATLTVWFIGYTDVATAPDHRIDVALNSTNLGRVEWDGKQAITVTLPITPGILVSGVNNVRLTLPGIAGLVEGAWLDAFAIDYARGPAASGNSAIFTGVATPHSYSLALGNTTNLRAYDVTNPDQPVQITNLTINGNTVSLNDSASGGPHRYTLTTTSGLLTPVALRMASSTANVTGADYVIVTHPNFTSALTHLIALRQAQGLTVTVENTQAIYDTYGDGRPDPEAIRAYLKNAYQNWTPSPTYVLLVGDGTFDPKLYRPTSTTTYVPPYLADVDPWAGETAADNRYVAFGGGAHPLPDLLLGRLPVNTLAEAQTVMDKIVQYETRPAPGMWNSNVALVADDPDPGAGNFPADSDLVASTYITAPYTAQKLYYLPPTTTVTSLHDNILFRWNWGASLIMFDGHSSIYQWAAERLFHLDDVASLNNGPHLPVVVELTCFTASFHDPGGPTLDEALVRRPNGGAVAVWGATGLGVATGHHNLVNGFMQSAYQQRQSLGAAALQGKLSVAATGLNLDLIDTFMLLGDPATRLNLTRVPGFSVFLPLIQR